MLLPAILALGGADSGVSAAEEGARADPAVCGLGSPIAEDDAWSGAEVDAADAAEALNVPGALEAGAEEPGAFRIGDVVLVERWMMSLPLTARLSFDFLRSLVRVSVRRSDRNQSLSRLASS